MSPVLDVILQWFRSALTSWHGIIKNLQFYYWIKLNWKWAEFMAESWGSTSTETFQQPSDIREVRNPVVVAMKFLRVDCTIFVNKSAEHRVVDKGGHQRNWLSTVYISYEASIISCLNGELPYYITGVQISAELSRHNNTSARVCLDRRSSNFVIPRPTKIIHKFTRPRDFRDQQEATRK
jgi:hypothetical protein